MHITSSPRSHTVSRPYHTAPPPCAPAPLSASDKSYRRAPLTFYSPHVAAAPAFRSSSSHCNNQDSLSVMYALYLISARQATKIRQDVEFLPEHNCVLFHRLIPKTAQIYIYNEIFPESFLFQKHSHIPREINDLPFSFYISLAENICFFEVPIGNIHQRIQCRV